LEWEGARGLEEEEEKTGGFDFGLSVSTFVVGWHTHVIRTMRSRLSCVSCSGLLCSLFGVLSTERILAGLMIGSSEFWFRFRFVVNLQRFDCEGARADDRIFSMGVSVRRA
jgi:hypothetical protein